MIAETNGVPSTVADYCTACRAGVIGWTNDRCFGCTPEKDMLAGKPPVLPGQDQHVIHMPYGPTEQHPHEPHPADLAQRFVNVVVTLFSSHS